jgi:hypothetical protein
MAEIVNLKWAKKAKARQAADEKAAVNRAHFGTSKAARKLAKARREKGASEIDAHKLDGENG